MATTQTAPRRGRPGPAPLPREQRRAERVVYLLTAADADRLARLAKRSGQTISGLTRAAVLALLAADGR